MSIKLIVARGTWIILVTHSLLVDLLAAHDTAFMRVKLWWGVRVSMRIEVCMDIVLLSYLEVDPA